MHSSLAIPRDTAGVPASCRNAELTKGRRKAAAEMDGSSVLESSLRRSESERLDSAPNAGSRSSGPSRHIRVSYEAEPLQAQRGRRPGAALWSPGRSSKISFSPADRPLDTSH